MTVSSKLVSYLVGGIPALIVGIGLVRAVELFSLPPVIGRVGLLTATVGVADVFRKIIHWTGRGGKAMADLLEHPTSKRFIRKQLALMYIGLLFLSGPVYFYVLKLQFIPRDQWFIYVVTLDPRVIVTSQLGGALFTGCFVALRHLVIKSCNVYLTPETIRDE